MSDAILSPQQSIQYQNKSIRIIMKDDIPWFCAKDICGILEIRNHRNAVTTLNADEKDYADQLDAVGRSQSTTFTNESGLYKLIFKSDKPNARTFQTWVTSEVLPKLRKSGAFSIGEKTQLLTEINQAEEKYRTIKQKLEQVESEKERIEKEKMALKEEKKQVENQFQIIDAENQHITILHENMKKKKIRFKCQKGPCVYLETNSLIEGYIKAGFTGNLPERLAYYETAQPARANLVYAIFSNNAKIIEDFIKAKYEKNRAPNKEWIVGVGIDVLKSDLKRLTMEISGDEFTELTEEEIHKKWDHLIASKRWEVKNPTSEKSATRIQNLIGETKKCAKCKEEKSKDEFGKDKVRADGLSCYCKPCKSAKTKEYGKKIREEKENSDPNDQSDIQEKKCTKCEELLPLDNFHAKTGSKDEKQPICKKCINEAKQQSRLKHKGEEHQCQHCSKTYKLKDSLTRHIKEKHSGAPSSPGPPRTD